MNEKKRSILVLLLSLVFLYLISYYRQLGLHSGQIDLLHSAVVYFGYLLLLIVWGISIYRRISQRNLCRYLYAEIVVMVLWLTVRFFQETLIRDLYSLRLSGYLICIPLVLLPLFGFYAVLGLEKGPDYHISSRWYFLLIPAAALMLLMLTNELHHIVFLAEQEINLYFRPNVGIYLIGIWAVVLEFARIVLLLQKSRRNQDYPHLRFLPFYAAIFMAMIFVPHFASSFAPQHEFIDLTAKYYFAEALIWESCICLGMVPINSQYSKVFEHSTVAMRITDPDGQTLIASRYAPPLSAAQFAILQTNHCIPLVEGVELCLHEIPGGYLVWQRDFTAINSLLLELQQTSEELQQENFLLQRELAAKSEEARIQAKNSIYDQLSDEVTTQMSFLNGLLRQDPADTQSWSKIGLIGTYIKRLCNLRLTYQETGRIEGSDLRLSIQNMLDRLEQLSVKTELQFAPDLPLSPEFAFMSIKLLQCVLEGMDFQLTALSVTISQQLMFEVQTDLGRLLPVDAVHALIADGFKTQWKLIGGGFTLTVRKVGTSDETIQ